MFPQRDCTDIDLFITVPNYFPKVLKRPRFDLGKLLDMHGEGKGAVAMETAEGEVVSRPEGYEPPVLDSV